MDSYWAEPLPRGGFPPTAPTQPKPSPPRASTLNYRDKGDENRKVCSLYLSLMDRMGVRLDRFGDADARVVGV
jgi:hypothetical protein